MNRMMKLGAVALVLGLAAFAALAATTYTAPPHWSAHSTSGSAANRWSTPVQGMLVVEQTTTAVTDQTIALDDQLAGYIERITVSHNGNDASWKLYLKDADGVTIWSKLDLDATADPVSYVVAMDDADGNAYGGVPIAGGLSIQIADADDGTGDAITVTIYMTEAWRR